MGCDMLRLVVFFFIAMGLVTITKCDTFLTPPPIQVLPQDQPQNSSLITFPATVFSPNTPPTTPAYVPPTTPAYVPLTTASNELIKYFIVVLKCNTTNNTNINNITTDNTSPCFNDDDDYNDIINMTWTQMNEVLKLNQYEFVILSMKNYPYWNDSILTESVVFQNITILIFMIKTLTTYGYNNTVNWLNNTSNYITIPRNAENLATHAYVTSWHKEYNNSQSCATTCPYICVLDDHGNPICINNITTNNSNNNGNGNSGSSSSNPGFNQKLLGLLAIPIFVILVILIGIIVYCCIKKNDKNSYITDKKSSKKSKYLQNYNDIETDKDGGSGGGGGGDANHDNDNDINPENYNYDEAATVTANPSFANNIDDGNDADGYTNSRTMNNTIRGGMDYDSATVTVNPSYNNNDYNNDDDDGEDTIKKPSLNF